MNINEHRATVLQSELLTISASILNADLRCLKAEIAPLVESVSAIHVDVMDNHFVPTIFGGPLLVRAAVESTTMPVDCHLMIENPYESLAAYVEAGAQSVSFHAEAKGDLGKCARCIRELGAKVGIALNPDTPLRSYLDDQVLGEIDRVLITAVTPGFGGQAFQSGVLSKIRALRAIIDESGLDILIEVDGGMNSVSIPMCSEAGADAFVVGTAIFGQEDSVLAARMLSRC